MDKLHVTGAAFIVAFFLSFIPFQSGASDALSYSQCSGDSGAGAVCTASVSEGFGDCSSYNDYSWNRVSFGNMSASACVAYTNGRYCGDHEDCKFKLSSNGYLIDGYYFNKTVNRERYTKAGIFTKSSVVSSCPSGHVKIGSECRIPVCSDGYFDSPNSNCDRPTPELPPECPAGSFNMSIPPYEPTCIVNEPEFNEKKCVPFTGNGYSTTICQADPNLSCAGGICQKGCGYAGSAGDSQFYCFGDNDKDGDGQPDQGTPANPTTPDNPDNPNHPTSNGNCRDYDGKTYCDADPSKHQKPNGEYSAGCGFKGDSFQCTADSLNRAKNDGYKNDIKTDANSSTTDKLLSQLDSNSKIGAGNIIDAVKSNTDALIETVKSTSLPSEVSTVFDTKLFTTEKLDFKTKFSTEKIDTEIEEYREKIKALRESMGIKFSSVFSFAGSSGGALPCYRFDWGGGSKRVCLSEYQSELSIIGQVLLIVVTLFSVMYIFRG